MSVYLRLVIGPIVVCDIDLFATVEKRDPDKEPPPQLAPQARQAESLLGFGRSAARQPTPNAHSGPTP